MIRPLSVPSCSFLFTFALGAFCALASVTFANAQSSLDDTIAEAFKAVGMPSKAEPPADEVAPGAYVQISAERTESAAVEKLVDLLQAGTNAAVQRVVVNGTTYYRVLIGPLESRRAAELEAARLKDHTVPGGAPFVQIVP